MLEVTVYSAILMGLLGGIYMLVHASLRYYRIGEVHQRVAEQASVGMRKMALDLGNSTPPSVSLPTTSAILFLSADQPYPGSGNWTCDSGLVNLQYKKWVCIFWEEASRNLVRTEDATAAGLPAVQPLAGVPTVPTLETMTVISPPRRTVLARSIVGLTFQLDPPSRVIIKLSAGAETASRIGHVTRVNLRTRVFINN